MTEETCDCIHADICAHAAYLVPTTGRDACMCGAFMDDHGQTENHAPVSETEYLGRQTDA